MNLELIQSIVNDSFIPADLKKKLILTAIATAEADLAVDQFRQSKQKFAKQ